MSKLLIRVRTPFALATLCFVAIGCSQSNNRKAVHVEQTEWTSPVNTKGLQLLTEHYDIRTTVQDALLRDYLPEFMEACNAEYRKLMPPPAQPESQLAGQVESPSTVVDRLVLFVFGRRPEWAAFTTRFAPANAYTYLHIHAGGYVDYPTATAVLFDIGRDRTLALMAHEGLHQYLACHFSRPVPPWLNEGLATQFEDFDLDGPRPTFRPRRNLIRKNSLREALAIDDSLIPLPQILAMDAGKAVVKTGQSARGYYAQIWAMTLFLRESRTYQTGLARLLADVGTDRYRANISGYRAATSSAVGMADGEVVFRQYITENVIDFGDEFKAFARELVR